MIEVAQVEQGQLELAKRAYVADVISLALLEELIGLRLAGVDIARWLPAPPLSDPGKPSSW